MSSWLRVGAKPLNQLTILTNHPNRMNAANKTSSGSILGLMALGFLVGLSVSGLALLFTGAGHGWGSGAISILSIVGAPLAGVAWGMRGRKPSRKVAVSALVVGLVSDTWLCAATVSEGVSYLSKAMSAVPVLFLLWLILFIGWQLVAAVAVGSPAATTSS